MTPSNRLVLQELNAKINCTSFFVFLWFHVHWALSQSQTGFFLWADHVFFISSLKFRYLLLSGCYIVKLQIFLYYCENFWSSAFLGHPTLALQVRNKNWYSLWTLDPFIINCYCIGTIQYRMKSNHIGFLYYTPCG